MEFFLPMLREKARSLGWDKVEVFADGWDDVPEDWNTMVDYADSNRLTHVLLLNGERWHGKSPEQCKSDLKKILDNGVIFHIYQGIVPKIHDEHTLSAFIEQIRAFTYFQEVMSLKTREGMRHKKGGRLPFGLKWENGQKVPDENYPLVQRTMEMYKREIPVPDIANMLNIKQSKVRSIIRAWKDHFNQ